MAENSTTYETDSERNIRLGQLAGARVIQASGTAVGRNADRTPMSDWKRGVIDAEVLQALNEGVTDPVAIRQRKMDAIERLSGLG